jgi:hypothetical protein
MYVSRDNDYDRPEEWGGGGCMSKRCIDDDAFGGGSSRLEVLLAHQNERARVCARRAHIPSHAHVCTTHTTHTKIQKNPNPLKQNHKPILLRAGGGKPQPSYPAAGQPPNPQPLATNPPTPINLMCKLQLLILPGRQQLRIQELDVVYLRAGVT